MKKFNIQEIEAILSYTFKNKDLLKQAFTRKSYAQENHITYDNEVLEFIGDSVLGMLVVKKLTERYTKTVYKSEEERELFAKALENAEISGNVNNYLMSELDESDLSEIKMSFVNKSSLAQVTEYLGLERYLFMGKGDCLLNIQKEKSVKEDLFEAIIGAVTIDCKWNMADIESVIGKTLDVDGRIENKVDGEPEYKELVEKWLKDHDCKNDFEYYHNPEDALPYSCSISIGTAFNCETIFGYGKTEKGALRLTAKRAWEYIIDITQRAEKIVEAVGQPDVNNAISQLQILSQKKIINEPEYSFEQSGVLESGNPGWSCFCTIKGETSSFGAWVMGTKAEAKKATAYEAMLYLTNNYN